MNTKQEEEQQQKKSNIVLQFNSGYLDICANCGADFSKYAKSQNAEKDMRCTGECEKFAPIINSYEERIRMKKGEELEFKNNHKVKHFLTKKEIISTGVITGIIGLFTTVGYFLNKNSKKQKNSKHNNNNNLFI
jgi:isoaspartyl peptidase/L-asparaginase-like protein (Ntn-hydrolase superfamily)